MSVTLWVIAWVIILCTKAILIHLMVGETETLEQDLSDKLRLGQLRVLRESLVPVVPTPTELKHNY